MKLLPERVKNSKIGEQIVNGFSGIRVNWNALRRGLWPTSSGISGMRVNYDATRQLYRNDGRDFSLGAGFCRPIIDNTVQFMGLPRAFTGDELLDEELNTSITKYWAPQLQEMIRDSTRDSLTIVRMRRKGTDNVLVTEEESDACYLEIVPPETCQIFYAAQDATWIETAIVTHEIAMPPTQQQIAQARRNHRDLSARDIHRIIETITPEDYTYWDETAGVMLDDWASPNTWGFVPLLEVHNEFEAYLGGGQSDLESPYVFIRAFHDVFGQTLIAHKQHSVPKAVFKVNDIMQYLANNYPDSFEKDASGQVMMETFTGSVNWQGNEIIFVQPEENVEFLEATSVLGDSKTLLSFILECIVISSETPKWAFHLDVGAADKTETMTFARKIDRKRVNFNPYIQALCKMSLAVKKLAPRVPTLSWSYIDPDELVTRSQALQQTLMAMEVGLERELISDSSARRHLRQYVPEMREGTDEATDAKDNFKLPLPMATGDKTATGGGESE